MIEQILLHKDIIAELILAILALGAVIVRLTPTETDNGLFHKIDVIINKILSFLNLPNNIKKDEDKKE